MLKNEVIKNAKVQKRELEINITNLIYEFEEETGLSVEDIDLHSIHDILNNKIGHTVNIIARLN